MLTPDELAARSRRAATAAADAGRALGLEVTRPAVLHDVFSVVVHLAPAPVVVRVPTVLPRSLTADAQRAQQQRELAVTEWLAGQRHPVVAPTPLVPVEPVSHAGFSMTFWPLVATTPGSDPTAVETARGIARLHAALAPCPVDLEFMVPFDESIPDMLGQLEGRSDLLDPADLARASQEWEILSAVLTSPDAFAAAFPTASVQPIHGDSPFYNVLHTADGALDSDFEHVSIGPVEWDLAFSGPDVVDTYEVSAARPVDRELVVVMEAARMVQLVACFALVPQLPMLAEGMRPALEHWRTTPVAGRRPG